MELRKILIVDDDADIVRIVSTMLENQGWQVLNAYSGEDALRVVESERPDLVLLDIMMPRMNGIEVLREARRIAPGMRVIMITAFGDVGSYLESMDLGACEYINKPFETGELLDHDPQRRRVLGRPRDQIFPRGKRDAPAGLPHALRALPACGTARRSPEATAAGSASARGRARPTLRRDARPAGARGASAARPTPRRASAVPREKPRAAPGRRPGCWQPPAPTGLRGPGCWRRRQPRSARQVPGSGWRPMPGRAPAPGCARAGRPAQKNSPGLRGMPRRPALRVRGSQLDLALDQIHDAGGSGRGGGELLPGGRFAPEERYSRSIEEVRGSGS